MGGLLARVTRHWGLAPWLLLVSSLLAFPARAQTEPGTLDEHDKELAALPQPPISADEKRPRPDYDGRGREPVTAGDVLIWIPRGIFYPVYLASEYLIRWPVGKLVSWLDVNDVPDLVKDFFTFGPGDKSGIVPSALIDFGFRASVGVYFFSDDTLWNGSAIRAHLAFGGVGWYRATGTLRHVISEDSPHGYASMVQIRGRYERRPDWQYFGIGANTFKDEKSHYGAQLVDGVLSYETGFWRSSRLRLDAGIRDARFQSVVRGKEPSVLQAVDMGFYRLPPLFDEGYLVSWGEIDGSLDTRERRNAYEGKGTDFVSPPGTGVKLAGRAKLVGGLRKQPGGERLAYIKYGGTLGGFVDLYQQRSLGLEAIVDFVDPLHDGGAIPFFDYVSLGGSRPLRGFLTNRLLGRSSAVAQLTYTWPIWAWLDGSLHYALGNTFDEHLGDFHPALLRQSFGGGFSTIGSRDHPFELLVALGTRTFDQGSGVDSVRFVLGSSTGF